MGQIWLILLVLLTAAGWGNEFYRFFVKKKTSRAVTALTTEAYSIPARGRFYIGQTSFSYRRQSSNRYKIQWGNEPLLNRHETIYFSKDPSPGVLLLQQLPSLTKKGDVVGLVFVFPKNNHSTPLHRFRGEVFSLGRCNGKQYFADVYAKETTILYYDHGKGQTTDMTHLAGMTVRSGCINPATGDILLEQTYQDNSSANLILLHLSGKVQRLFSMSMFSEGWNRPYDWLGKDRLVFASENGLTLYDVSKNRHLPIYTRSKCYNPRVAPQGQHVAFLAAHIQNVKNDRKQVTHFYNETNLLAMDISRVQGRNLDNTTAEKLKREPLPYFTVSRKVSGSAPQWIGPKRFTYIKDSSGLWNANLVRPVGLYLRFYDTVGVFHIARKRPVVSAANMKATFRYRVAKQWLYTTGRFRRQPDSLFRVHRRYGAKQSYYDAQGRFIHKIVAVLK